MKYREQLAAFIGWFTLAGYGLALCLQRAYVTAQMGPRERLDLSLLMSALATVDNPSNWHSDISLSGCVAVFGMTISPLTIMFKRSGNGRILLYFVTAYLAVLLIAGGGYAMFVLLVAPFTVALRGHFLEQGGAQLLVRGFWTLTVLVYAIIGCRTSLRQQKELPSGDHESASWRSSMQVAVLMGVAASLAHLIVTIMYVANAREWLPTFANRLLATVFFKGSVLWSSMLVVAVLLEFLWRPFRRHTVLRRVLLLAGCPVALWCLFWYYAISGMQTIGG